MHEGINVTKIIAADKNKIVVQSDGSDRSENIFYHVGEVPEHYRRYHDRISTDDPVGMQADGFPLNGEPYCSILVDTVMLSNDGSISSVSGRMMRAGFLTRERRVMSVMAHRNIPRKTGFTLHGGRPDPMNGIEDLLLSLQPGDTAEIPADMFKLTSLRAASYAVRAATGVTYACSMSGGKVIITAEAGPPVASSPAPRSKERLAEQMASMAVGDVINFEFASIASARTTASNAGHDLGRKFSVSGPKRTITRIA